ncbi:MAG: cytochrome c oxidase subunit II [Bacteroidales bacterium]|nr:cytochrome c oxidase subunit II [Bacteroidales bacterium]
MITSNLSNLARGVDTAFIVILSVIFFFLIGLTVVLIIFILRYRESKNPVASQIHGNNKLEIIWTVIPLLIVMAMFYFGWTGWKPMDSAPPDDAFEIETTARMWKWSFKYPNGKRLDTLVIPAGKPVSLNMNSLDVIHSIYIPAFRLKKDINPGSERNAWFIANTPGIYDLFCTEYCGLEHSSMISSVKVLSADEFESWYADSVSETHIAVKTEVSASSRGKQIVQQLGCNACHSADGTKIVGPSYLGVFGHEVTVIRDGKTVTVTADEDYIRRSILDPNFEIVEGYNKGLMLSYEDLLSDEELDLIVEYIKSLN